MKPLRDSRGLAIPCHHSGCSRWAVKICGAADENNTLGQTHDCCSRHCPIRTGDRHEH